MYRDRDRAAAKFHAALAELHQLPLLAECGASVPAAAGLTGPELMAVAAAAAAFLATIQQHLEAHANGCNWAGGYPLFLPVMLVCTVSAWLSIGK